MVKRKTGKVTSKRKPVSSKRKGGSEDAKARRKYARGGRIEAYTFGEAQRSKDWP